jgi:hypothetical protein
MIPSTRVSILAAAVGLVLAFCSFAAQAATYEFRQAARGLVAAPPPPAPSSLGDGVAKAGACASGAQVGCIEWKTTGVSGAIVLSGSPVLKVSTGDCHGPVSCTVNGTKSYTSGKWYWEYTLTKVEGQFIFGIAAPAITLNATPTVFYYTAGAGQFRVGNAQVPATNMGHALGDVFSFALDLDGRTVTVMRNGVLVKSAVLPTGLKAVTPAVGEDWYSNPDANRLTANFGQRAFSYPVPVGYNAGLW